MQQNKDEKRLGIERLEQIIATCTAIESHQSDPFNLNIEEIIKVVKAYFPHWDKPDELKLDAEALYHLATVIKMQSEWIKQRSSSLYADPFLLEEKIRQTNKEQMAEVLINAWSPIIEFEQLSIPMIAQSLLYWDALAPIGDRWKAADVSEIVTGSVTREEMIKQRVLSDKEFSQELEAYWFELKTKVETKSTNGRIAYWDFIGSETYEETVQRAFLTSFLVTYGYATLEIDRLEETINILPFRQQRKEALTEQSTSVPIAIPFENWQKWKRGEKL
jgi:hypothetical protein